jgi:hypothetical protein
MPGPQGAIGEPGHRILIICIKTLMLMIEEKTIVVSEKPFNSNNLTNHQLRRKV